MALHDVFEESSFSSLIQQEEREEVVPLDLHTASLIGDYDTVRGFIAAKSPLDRLNRGGWTPLMYAAYVGRDNILNLLLEAGAKIDIPSKKDGLTALMFASYCASESIMYFLLQHGASINARDLNGLTSLFHAVRQGHQSTVKLLASHGADLDLGQYQTGITPLMEAAIGGHENIFSILLDHGADIERRTKKGKNLRSLAMRYGNTMIVSLIDKATTPQQGSLREEAKLGDSERLFNSSSTREANIRDGPAAISNLFVARGMNPPNSQQTPIAALCPDFTNMMSRNNTVPPPSTHYDTIAGLSPGPQEASHLQMSGVSPSHSASQKAEYPNEMNVAEENRHKKKVSRIASEKPKNIFTTQWPQELRPIPETLREVLEEHKLESHLPKFESQGIDITAFLELTDGDLKEIGVDKLGPRKKIVIAIAKCKERLKTCNPNTDHFQTEQYQVQIQDLTVQLQQAFAFIKQLQAQLYNEQQYRSEFNNYLEAEQRRMRQIVFNINDVGKNCKEASVQVRKIKDYNSRIGLLLEAIKEHPNNAHISSELGIDSSLLESANSIKCEIEMVSNRLDITFKQVERTLMVAQIDMPRQVGQPQQYNGHYPTE